MPKAFTSAAPDPADSAVAQAILDAAEQAFVEHGYGGASLRSIAREAGVNQAMVSYYFESKEGLFSAVIGRRSIVINDQRRQRLAEMRQRGSIGLPDVIRALIEPAIRLNADVNQGGEAYMKLVGQLTNSTDPLSQRVLSSNYDEIASLFIAEINNAEPSLGIANAARGYVLTIAVTMASVGSEWRISKLAKDSDSGLTVDEIIESTTRFAVAGIRSLSTSDR